MPTLRELQAGFAAALLGGSACVTDAVVEDGLAADARLEVYRHHVRASLAAVLAAAFPVVRRLVDDRFFAYAADTFVRRHPPAGPCLFEYGAGFPGFLAGFPPCRHLAYLPDVARLEWALCHAVHAEDATALTVADLAAVPPDATPGLTLRLHPSITLLGSAWPVDEIWRANQGADPGSVDASAGGAWLEARRMDGTPVFRRLARGDFELRRALGHGASLEAAAERALVTDPGFALAPAIRALLDEGAVVGLDHSPRTLETTP